MLKTAEDFENSILFLNAGINDKTFDDLIYQSNTMDSDNFNTAMNFIEANLDSLYEKSRILEDVIVYTKTFLEQNIYSVSKECQTIIDNIESEIDSTRTSSYISYDVPISESTGSYLDRDRTELSHADIHNGMITLSGISTSNVALQSIGRTSNAVPYRTNVEALNKGESYRSFYFLDAQAFGGFKETFTLYFTSPVLINYLEISPVNCKVTRITYKNSNDSIEDENLTVSNIVKDRIVKSIEFDIVSELYKKQTFNVDTLNMATNYWDSVEEATYGSVSTVASFTPSEFKTASLVEQDARFGSERVFRDYSDYLLEADKYYNSSNQLEDYTDYLKSKETSSVDISNYFSIPIKITKTYEFANDTSLSIDQTSTYDYNGRTYTLWAIGAYTYLGSYTSGTKTINCFQQTYGAILEENGSRILAD